MLFRRRLPRDVYRRRIFLVVGSDAELNAFCRPLGYPFHPNARGQWMSLVDDEQVTTDHLCFWRGLLGHERAAIVGHECLHLTFRVLSDAGLTLSASSAEAYTYYHQWLVEEVLDRWP
jgi:hypothetical protein